MPQLTEANSLGMYEVLTHSHLQLFTVGVGQHTTSLMKQTEVPAQIWSKSLMWTESAEKYNLAT